MLHRNRTHNRKIRYLKPGLRCNYISIFNSCFSLFFLLSSFVFFQCIVCSSWWMQCNAKKKENKNWVSIKSKFPSFFTFKRTSKEWKKENEKKTKKKLSAHFHHNASLNEIPSLLCMYPQNFTLSTWMHPKLYESPYIGNGATKLYVRTYVNDINKHQI